MYSVVHQDSGMRKGLLAAKARLWKEGFIITRLELISANKAANDVDNVCSVVCVWMDRDYSALVLDCRSRELQTVCAL